MTGTLHGPHLLFEVRNLAVRLDGAGSNDRLPMLHVAVRDSWLHSIHRLNVELLGEDLLGSKCLQHDDT